MESFSNISKTNYLDIEVDQAKSTNDLIAQEQQMWNRHFQIAIQEAGRLERAKAAQSQQLFNLIGKGAQFAQKLKKWEETKDWQRLNEYTATGEVKDPIVQKRIDDLKEREKKANKENAENETVLNDAINSSRDDPTAKEGLNDEQASLAVRYKYSTAYAITKNKRISATYVAKKFPDFTLQIFNDTSSGELAPDGSPDSIAAAVNRADWTQLKKLRKYYNNVFLNLSQLDDIPGNILRETVYAPMEEHWEKQTAQYKNKERQRSLEVDKQIKFRELYTCVTDLDGKDKIGCIVGSKEEGSIGFVAANEMRNGKKDTRYAWDLAITAVDKGLTDDDLHWSDVHQMIEEGKIKPRGKGSDAPKETLEKVNKKYYEKLAALVTKFKAKEDQEEQLKKTVVIKTALDKYIGDEGEFQQLIDQNIEVTESDVLNAVQNVKSDLNSENIQYTEEDLKPLLSFITAEDKDDQGRVDQLRRQMLDNPGKKIHNWRQQVNQIKDPTLRGKVTEELKKHHAIDEDILEKFERDLDAMLINKYPNESSTVNAKSAQWLTEERNATEYFKDKYRELINTPGTVDDPYQAAVNDTATQHSEGKFNYRETPKKDTEFIQSLKSVKAHIDSSNNKEVLKQKAYWAGEEKAIQQALAYLSGEQNDRAVDYYLSLQKLFPNHTWYELMKKRMEVLGITDKETAGKVKTEAFVIPEREHAKELGPDSHLVIDSNRNSPNRTYRVLINPENTEWMLDTIQVSSNPNNIQNWPGPAILRPNLKLEDTPLDRVSNMVKDTNMRVGLYGLTHRSFKTLEEAGVLDYYKDTPFDAETQKELMVHLSKLNSNKQNLSTLSGGYKRLMSLPKETLDEFNALDEDNLNISPFNQIDNLIPAAADVVIKEGYQPTFQESFEETGIYKTYNWLRNLDGPKKEETDEVPTPYTGGGL